MKAIVGSTLSAHKSGTKYADSYEICGNDKGDRNIVTYTRTIKPGHYLRPIPQGQLDGMEMSADEKKNYQNPEYR